MRRVASELGIKAPSLYKHLGSKAELEAALQQTALEEQAAAFTAVGTHLEAMATAYRRWALAHPQLYQLLTRGPLERGRVPSTVEAAAAAPLLAAAGGDPDRARALWGLAHGLVDLELAGRFPPGIDVDRVWAAGLAGFPSYGGVPAGTPTGQADVAG